jgi:peptide/nickel transport system permease protein
MTHVDAELGDVGGRSPAEFWGAIRRLKLMDQIALALLLGLVVIAVFAPLIAPASPTTPSGKPLSSPSWSNWLGTDEVGLDILSRIIYGLRLSLLGAVVVISSGVIVGGAIGLVAGAVGGWVDTILMRFTDLFLALPAPVLAIAVVAAIGPSFWHTLLAVGIVWWPWYARIVRGEVNALRARPYVEAARLAGVGRLRLWFRHLLPGSVPAVLVVASLDVGYLVVILAGLSFLGLGAPHPSPELGAMAAQGLRYLLSKWWVPVFPGIAVALLAYLSNLAGDGLRDLLGER